MIVAGQLFLASPTSIISIPAKESITIYQLGSKLHIRRNDGTSMRMGEYTVEAATYVLSNCEKDND